MIPQSITMKISLLVSFLALFFAADLHAQFYGTQYRSPGQQWHQLRTERFRVIYPKRYQTEAERTLSILELEYADIQDLVGGRLQDFPVILNPENDRSNGFVSPFNFRSEIEIAPFAGKSLSPRSGDWLETVVPHELVHALHFSVNPPSIVRPIGLFAPDARRSLHGAAPAGLLEGIAVEHESHNTMPASGRGNYPLFNNQFYSMIGADMPWSMGQLVHSTTFTPPFTRHYMGGYAFVHWLRETHGENAMRKAIKRHYKLPFLGFGFALKTTTGRWPGTLYRQFMREQQQVHQKRTDNLSADTDARSRNIPFSATCRRSNRPLFLPTGQLLFYARSCNRPSGFYLHDSESNSSRLLHEVSIVGDHHYALVPGNESLIYSRYHTGPIYDNQFRADLHILNLDTAEDRRLTHNLRLTSPSFSGGRLYAAQTDGHTRRLVQVDPESGEILTKYPMVEHSTVISVSPGNSSSGAIAILGKKHGVQAIWFEDPGQVPDSLFQREPDIVFERASIFDPVWSPDGNKLLFTADTEHSMNIFEFDTETSEVHQLTDSRYSAFEGTYSGEQQQIAYILQREDEQLPAVLEMDQSLGRTLDPNEWTVTQSVRQALDRPLLNRYDQAEANRTEWRQSRYSSGLSWLKPRIWLPTVESVVDDADRIGLSLESADRMSRHAYSLEVSRFAKSFWFDGTYRYTGRYPGFELNVFNSPFTSSFRLSTEEGESFIFRTIRQRRGGTLSIPFRYKLEQNAHFSSFLVEPEFSVSQTRFTDLSDANRLFSDFEGILYTAGLNTILNYRLRQHIRDVQPNSGLQFFTQTRYGLNSTPLTLRTPGGEASSTFSQRKGFRAGVIGYVAPLQKFNQSLRLSLQSFTQTPAPVFNTESVISNLFETLPAAGASNIGIFDSRYTIPLIYPDDGGLLLPVYLSNIYLVLFSQTVANLNRPLSDARSLLGAGVRTRFKLGNLQLDLGFSVGWEPATNSIDYLFGDF